MLALHIDCLIVFELVMILKQSQFMEMMAQLELPIAHFDLLVNLL